MPIKNEDWILDTTLFALSKICDYVIIADSNSEDNSKQIIQKYPNCVLLEKKAKSISSDIRSLLIDYARDNFEGNNLFISLDADEIFTADISPDIISYWKSLPIGTSVALEWLQLWRSTNLIRDDNSIWCNNWKYFCFIDDRSLPYAIDDDILDHRGRMPFDPTKIYHDKRVSVLHFQFAHFERMLSKQCHYRIIEKIEGKKKSRDINLTYNITKDEKNIKLKKITPDKYKKWKEQGISFDINTSDSFFWYDIEILKYFMKFGTRFFWDLDIWDINWEVKRQMALAYGHDEFESLKIKVPSRLFEIVTKLL